MISRVRRPDDHSRDPQILAITLDASFEQDYEQDYEHVTINAVSLRAGRAKTTLSRRRPSKVDLVFSAISAADRPLEADDLPDVGSLRSDLMAVIDPS